MNPYHVMVWAVIFTALIKLVTYGINKRWHRKVEWWFQRLFRGYADVDIWNLNHHMADVLLPRLKAYRKECVSGFPAGCNNMEAWYAIQDKVIEGFTYISLDDDDIAVSLPFPEFCAESERRAKVAAEAAELFGKYFNDYWD